jgi:hypothetical protein
LARRVIQQPLRSSDVTQIAAAKLLLRPLMHVRHEARFAARVLHDSSGSRACPIAQQQNRIGTAIAITHTGD